MNGRCGAGPGQALLAAFVGGLKCGRRGLVAVPSGEHEREPGEPGPRLREVELQAIVRRSHQRGVADDDVRIRIALDELGMHIERLAQQHLRQDVGRPRVRIEAQRPHLLHRPFQEQSNAFHRSLGGNSQAPDACQAGGLGRGDGEQRDVDLAGQEEFHESRGGVERQRIEPLDEGPGVQIGDRAVSHK